MPWKSLGSLAGVSRGSPGVCAIVDAWWTSSARHGRAVEITRGRNAEC